MRTFLSNSMSAPLSAQLFSIISLSRSPHGESLLFLTSHMKNVGLREVSSRVPQLSMTQTGSYLQVCFLQSPVVLTYAQHHMPELEIIYTTYTNGKDPSTGTQRCSKGLFWDCNPCHSLYPVGNLFQGPTCRLCTSERQWFFHLDSPSLLPD